MPLESICGLQQGEAAFLLATDVAARGLDILGVDAVINYDAPGGLSGYLHRIGRTARAGAAGRAVTFAEDGDRGLLKEARPARLEPPAQIFFFFFFSWRAPSVLSCGWRSEVVLVVGSGYLLVGCVRRHAPAPLQACMHFSKRGASAVDVDGLTRVRCLGRGPRRGGDQVGGWARSARAPCRGCMPRSGARAQVVKKTRAALVTRVIPAAAVAEWRGRIEAMADDVDRLVQARTAGPQGPRFKGQPRGFASDAEPSTRAVVCAWGGQLRGCGQQARAPGARRDSPRRRPASPLTAAQTDTVGLDAVKSLRKRDAMAGLGERGTAALRMRAGGEPARHLLREQR